MRPEWVRRRQSQEEPGKKGNGGGRQDWKKSRKAFVGLGKEFGFYSDQERFYGSSYLRGVAGSWEGGWGGSIRSRGNSVAYGT